MEIHIVIMGGTIDSYWDGTKDTAIPLKESVVPRYLGNCQLYEKVNYTTVCLKDSRALTVDDLKKMLEVIEKSESKFIMVTHGTYTMPDSARFLQANLKRKDQVIVFVASMIPIDGFTFSDAGFNLGYAMGKMESLKEGVYVSMNGRIFSPNEVVKMLSEGRFASVME